MRRFNLGGGRRGSRGWGSNRRSRLRYRLGSSSLSRLLCRSVGRLSIVPASPYRRIRTMRPNRTKMMLRTVCLSDRSGDVPGGTARSGRCGAPQLGQKLAVGRISVPQFSQKRLPSDKQRSLLPGGLLTAPNTRHTCRLGQLDVRYGPIPDDCGPAQAGVSVVRVSPGPVPLAAQARGLPLKDAVEDPGLAVPWPGGLGGDHIVPTGESALSILPVRLYA